MADGLAHEERVTVGAPVQQRGDGPAGIGQLGAGQSRHVVGDLIWIQAAQVQPGDDAVVTAKLG
jgi:hypothetical protein